MRIGRALLMTEPPSMGDGEITDKGYLNPARCPEPAQRSRWICCSAIRRQKSSSIRNMKDVSQRLKAFYRQRRAHRHRLVRRQSQRQVAWHSAGAVAARAAISRAGLARPGEVDNSVFETVIPTEAADLFLGRTVAVEAGACRPTLQGLTVNRLCGSGAQAIISAAQMIRHGDSKIAIAGGAEVHEPLAILDHGHAIRSQDGRCRHLMTG